jgi:hypothetical protein
MFKHKNTKQDIQIFSLAKDKEIAAHVTASSCWRPDIYLNNERYCNGCIIYGNCCCPIKRLDKKRPDEILQKKKLQKKKW